MNNEEKEDASPLEGKTEESLPVVDQQEIVVDEEEGKSLSDQIFTYEGFFNTKEARLAEIELNDLPERYTSNNRKEELCLEYVDNFVRQFQALFPDRKPLFLTPKNECGVPKFVCTTIRPTQLPFKGLYNVGTAAEFFSHFIQYEPLDDALRAPLQLPSPTFTLSSQIGDCFELSTLLCSYLVGSGYDAYCVHGYAPVNITLLNRREETCPLLNSSPHKNNHEELAIEDLRGLAEQNDVQEEEEDWSAILNAQESNEADEAAASGQATGEENNSEEKTSEESKQQQEEPQEASEAAESGVDQEGKEGEDEADQDKADNSIAVGVPDEGKEEDDTDPYAVNFSGVLDSEYLRKMKARAEAQSETKQEEEEDLEEEELEEIDALHGKRVHCWVLVRAGKRGVEKSFFVEPTTGRLYNVYGSPYLGVEAVWNNRNYWVNMQTSTQGRGTDSAEPQQQHEEEDLMNLSYNLDVQEHWEYIFVDKIGQVKDDNRHGEQEDVGAGMVGEKEGDQAEEGKADEMILDLPPSWVSRLVFTRDAYQRKYNTTGQRVQLFHKSKLESYSEHLHSHGLVKRLVLFKDKGCTLPIEVREYFANRKDKLTLRVRFPLDGRVIENFSEGRSSGLRMIDEVVGKSRDIHFYLGARLDGLVQREEIIGKKIIERFEGRDDHLERRSMNVALLGNDDDLGSSSGLRSGGSSEEKKSCEAAFTKSVLTLPRASMGGDLAILKMKQVFSRNTDKEADADIAKRTFHLSSGTISVIYHYCKGKIVRSSRLFSKDVNTRAEIKLSGTFAQPLRPSQIEEEFQMNLHAEKDCYQNIRDGEREIQDILGLRKREEAGIVLEKSIFNTAREHSKEDTIKQAENLVQEDKDPRHVDYLTPFLQHIPNVKKIKRQEAEAARDACLKSLKERLLERANIIQCRLDEENSMLAKKQAAFQRSRDHVDGADVEFERFCSEAMFRIQILEQRLARHEESALSVYANLDTSLRNDPRLAVLNQN